MSNSTRLNAPLIAPPSAYPSGRRPVRTGEHDMLASGARELGIDLAPARAETLLDLVDALEQGNAQFNLTAIRDRTGMLQKHVLDSMSLQPYLRGERIADVGTGAGFPGLVLAVVNPERRFTLIEATGKKARFVEQTAQRIGCANVLVVNSRAETYRPFELFDTVVARALSSLADFVAYAGHLCAPGGRLLAMKGKRPDDEISALPKSFRARAVHRLKVPGLTDERHLVELTKK
ncbi:MAG TPA: 16S rRNA (guanine(527)-N(7))-methyltransferase RsmG [Steroidobacteraceae bacterium]